MSKKKKNKKKKIIIGIVIIIAIIAMVKITSQKEEKTVKIETEAIEKRTIAQSISSTGIIKANNTKEVVSTLTGMKITAVNVKEGDKVSADDIICTFDTSSLANNLNDLQKSISVGNAQSTLGVQGARRSLNDAITNRDAQINSSKAEVDRAANAYNQAVDQLNSARAKLNEQNSNLANIEALKKAAQIELDAAKKDYDPKRTLYEQKLNEFNAKSAEVAAVKAEYNQYFDDFGQKLQGTNYSDAQYEQIRQKYADAKAGLAPIETAFRTAESQYLASKANYDSKLANLNQYNTVSQGTQELQAQIAQLEATVSNLKQAHDATVTAYNSAVSASNSSVASLQDGVATQELGASISTQTQATQVKELQKQLAEGNLKAGVSGTVTKVNVKTGDIYTGTQIAIIEGCEDLIVEAEISEYDIPDIQVGMKVLIKTDATRDEELEGRVIYTAVTSSTSSLGSASAMTGATTVSSNATYTVKIALDSQNDRLRLGMNAKLSVITDMKENVWSVPYDSVYTREDGTKYIEIAKNETGEEKEELDVTTGIEGTYYIEIISDKLKDGMKVVLPQVDAGNSIESLIEMMGPDAGL